MTSIEALVAQIKASPEYPKVGMILCHNGVVRGTSRDGRKVDGLQITVDKPKLAEILARQKGRDGIVEILVEINDSDFLKVGDDVMYLVVAGDIRENVLAVLTETLNEIKSTVTAKKENFR
jgi:molybdopterin synthase catalytic subunit